MMYDDPELIDIWEMKRLPQFVNLTDTELRIIAFRIAREEARQYEAHREAQLQRERMRDKAWIEEHSQEKALPSEPVVIKPGIIISPAVVDDKGFASHDDLSHQKRTLKMSLEGTTKKIYL